MPAPQPGAVVNVMLLVLCGTAGWFVAAWTKNPPAPVTAAISSSPSGGLEHQPGVFAADARLLLARDRAGAREFDELLARYGSGSTNLALLAAPVMEKWAAADPADAASAGLTRCMAHAPDLMPQALAALASGAGSKPDALLAAVPAGPLRTPCLAALAAAWGTQAREDALSHLSSLTRGERTIFLRAWHRARALSDFAAAEKSAAALTDADDRESALAGCQLGRAAADPAAVLRDAVTREDFPLIAAAAFRHWLPRDSTAAWSFVSGRKDDPRIATLCAALIQAELERRRASDALPEIQTLLARHFPAGPPLAINDLLVPALAAESSAAARKYVESLPAANLQMPATVRLFDVLCTTDPAAAWRLAETSGQRDGTKDGRTTHRWTSALARETATPQQRLDAGFPDFTDMVSLARHWLESDPPAAIATFCTPGVPAALQRLIIDTALHPDGAAIPRDQLLEWARRQAQHLLHTIEALADH